MQHPTIMGAFLEQHSDELLGLDASANGVVSSIIMRCDTTPAGPFIREFTDRQPSGPGSHLSELWDVHIKTPGINAIDKYYTGLRDHGRLGEVFRYQNLSALVAGL